MHVFKTSGVCAKEIHFDINDGVVTDINFINGCAGNLLGIKALVTGKSVEEVIEKLKGIPCGSKTTSCPDQLAEALEAYLKA